MLLKFNDVLTILKRKEQKALKDGYLGDASSYAFKRYTLIFLERLARGKPKKPSAWNRFCAEFLKNGKTVKEASEAWQAQKK